MKRRRYTKLTIKEISGVDLGAQEGAKVAFRKRLATLVEVGKRMTMTSSSSGHTHLVCGYDNSDVQGGETDGAYMDGSDYGSNYHRHPWVRVGEAYVIGEMLGHTHVMLDDAAITALATATAAGSSPVTSISSDSNKRAPSPAPTPTPAAKAAPTAPAPKEPAMAMTPEEIARLERAEALAIMTDAEKRHHARLTAPERVTFEKLAPAARAEIVTADKVVYVAKHGHLVGRAFRASDEAANPDILALVRSVDDEAEKRIAAEKRATRVTLEKRAGDELEGFAGTTAERADLLELIDGVTDEAKRTRLIEIVKGASSVASIVARELGTGAGGGEPDPTSPLEAFQGALVAFAKSKNLPAHTVTAEFIETDDGGALYDAAYPHVPG